MKISDLAKAANTQPETIRHYERKGLLPEATRTAANYRSYDASHLQRLAFIRHCRSLDMTLEEIRTLLHFKDAPGENCGQVNELLDAHVGHVARRIRELQGLQKELKALKQLCAHGQEAADCGILTGLEQAAMQSHERPAREHDDHIHGAHQRVG